MLRRCVTGTLAALVSAANAAPPDNCEEIRSTIEQKIRAAGATAITVTALEPGASAPGQVVGRCAHGTRTIVYRRESPSGTATGPRPVPMITECRDGSAPVNGQCPKK